jgi:RsiW-degrading membrane proteinase PrsW (M82 family)
MAPGEGSEMREQSGSVFDEPHFRAQLRGPTPSKSDRALSPPPLPPPPDPLQHVHSVSNEPWAAAASVGQAPGNAYRQWWEEQAQQAHPLRSWLLTVLLSLLAGPLAVVTTFLESFSDQSGLWLIFPLVPVIVAPVVEEASKVAVALLILDSRPYWFRSAVQILACAMGGGLGFAVIENLLYLNIYIPDPSEEIIRWRWTVCVALHVTCSTLVGVGLVRAWQEAWAQGRKPEITAILPWYGVASVLHGLYNLMAMILQWVRVFS